MLKIIVAILAFAFVPMPAHAQDAEPPQFQFRLPGEQVSAVPALIRRCDPGGPNAGLQFDIRASTLLAVVLDLLPNLVEGVVPDWGTGAPFDVVCGWSGRGPDPAPKAFSGGRFNVSRIDQGAAVYTKSRRLFARGFVQEDHRGQDIYTGEDVAPIQSESVIPGAILPQVGLSFPGLRNVAHGDTLVLYPAPGDADLTGVYKYDVSWTPYAFIQEPHVSWPAMDCPNPQRPTRIVHSQGTLSYHLFIEVSTNVDGPWTRLPEGLKQLGTVERFLQICE